MARGALIGLLAFAAGWLSHQAVTPIAPFDVHVSGDGSAQIADALFARTGPVRAFAAEDAGLQVVSFRRWQNIETLTSLISACGGACDGAAPVVRLRRPSLNGMTEVLFIDLSAYGAGDALDAGRPMDEGTVDCIAERIARVRYELSTADSKCAVPGLVEITRPRFWTPRPS